MNESTPYRVFTAVQLEEMRNSRSNIQYLMGVLEQVEQCGIDCTGYRAQARQVDQGLSSLLERFGLPKE